MKQSAVPLHSRGGCHLILCDTRRILTLPELPEVEEVRRQLQPAMEGVRIHRVTANRPDLRHPLPVDFVKRLEGTTVVTLRRRAKYLIASLSSGDQLLMHLGMSGSFRIEKRLEMTVPHDHVVFEMSSGTIIVFNDPRRFGSMAIVPSGQVEHDRSLSALGPEPLASTFTAKMLAASLKGKRTPLKAALLDQRVVAGLGNIYVSEALHVARLSPRRRASTLATTSGSPRPTAERLVPAIKQVLREAVAAQRRGGLDRFRVYDREARRCPRRGCGGTIRRIVQAGRSTYYCPVCQR
jgi:formamidopyrimidine-DNA glycosylase